SRVLTGLYPNVSGQTNRRWQVVQLDQDGRPALLSHTRGSDGTNTGTVYRYQNGQFTQQTLPMPAVIGWDGAKCKLADLDNDGRDDILYLKAETPDPDTNPLGQHPLGIIWRTATDWAQGPEAALPFSVVHAGWSAFNLPAIDYFASLKILDMNRDGRPEILLRGATLYTPCGGTCTWYWQTGAYQLQLTAAGGWQAQAIPAAVDDDSLLADVNGDGYPDLVNVTTVWLSNGQYPATQVYTQAPAYSLPIAADLDGDGASELIYSTEHLPQADPAIPPEQVDTYVDPDPDDYVMVRFSSGGFSAPVLIWS